MNTFVIEEFYVDESNKCNFYTVRFDDHKVSETDKFYDKYFLEGHEFYDDMGIIHALIEELAESGIGIIRRARDEAKAYALPPEVLRDTNGNINVAGNNLRLYYVELSNSIIILLGGGVAHEGANGHPPLQLHEAQIFVKKIVDALGVEFEVRNKRIVSLGGDEIIIN